MIKLIMSRYFGEHVALAHCLVKHTPTPKERAGRVVDKHYRGDGEFKEEVRKGLADGLLLCNVVKMYHTKDYKSFYAWGVFFRGR